MNQVNQLSRDDAIYIAGLFDGEGCITLSKASRLREKRKTPTYVLRARIRMTDGALVKWLHAVIGGRYYAQRKPSQNPERRKPYYEWGVAGKNAVKFLQQVFPYLRVKRLQAEVAFRYGQTRMKGYHKKLSFEVINAREGLRDIMLELNKRGIQPKVEKRGR